MKNNMCTLLVTSCCHIRSGFLKLFTQRKTKFFLEINIVIKFMYTRHTNGYECLSDGNAHADLA